jgi:hypothetical protein
MLPEPSEGRRLAEGVTSPRQGPPPEDNRENASVSCPAVDLLRYSDPCFTAGWAWTTDQARKASRPSEEGAGHDHGQKTYVVALRPVTFRPPVSKLRRTQKEATQLELFQKSFPIDNVIHFIGQTKTAQNGRNALARFNLTSSPRDTRPT